ncbi:MAG TPA: hypothetical protein VKR06_29595 [Ktedonosporobacter sp.]|nr:hypothetical protein [Ktedonosporobacter sp.]
MSKPDTGVKWCPTNTDTTVIRVGLIGADYRLTLDASSGVPVDGVVPPSKVVHVKIYQAGIPPFLEFNFEETVVIPITGQPFFQVDVRPLDVRFLRFAINVT